MTAKCGEIRKGSADGGRSMNLAELYPGQTGVVTGYGNLMSMRRRLQDLGMIRGTKIECLGRSPLGDPAAYLVRKTVIALRREDALQITVSACGKEADGGGPQLFAASASVEFPGKFRRLRKAGRRKWKKS